MQRILEIASRDVEVSGFKDCRGDYHRTEDDRHEADVAIVTEVLDAVAQRSEEYCTENTDYADGYVNMVDERSHNWPRFVEDWIRDEYPGRIGYGQFYNCMDLLVNTICENMEGGFDCEPEYSGDEYGAYSGSGCCLDSFDIGEHEEQIDISCYDELQVLHDEGRLDDVLDDVNCDAYISRSRRREKNEDTGCYEFVGRKTYMPNPTFCIYTNPGGRWHFVVSADRMRELVTEAIIELASKV